jgi:hypothetical protein
MPFTEDITAFFDITNGFAEQVTLAGLGVAAVVDVDTPLLMGDVLASRVTSVLVAAALVPGAAEGQSCVVRGVAHVVRQVLKEPPDGAVLRLVLARS